MFRNKILVRAKLPFSPSASPFLRLHLRLDPPPSFPSYSPISDPASSADLSLFVRVETLCWKLSRAWRVACLCFPHSPEITVVYQKSQSESVDQVVKELVEQLSVGCDVGPEEAASGTLVVKAVECVLKCTFLDSGWRCLGNGLFVDSDFSRDDERSYICALDVRVQMEINDGFIFLVSPDVVCFSRDKIADFLSYKMEPNFCNGEEVILDNHNPARPCYVLPSLYEGYVIGLGKVLPSGNKNLGHFEDLWSYKHGLALPSDYFIKIQFTFSVQANIWLPSAFVLQGSRLSPAPQTARVLKAVSALDSFIKIFEGWNFFGQGWPIVQVVSKFNAGSELYTWTKAADAVNVVVSRVNADPSTNKITNTKVSIPTNLLCTDDFRAPKPAGCIVGYRKLEHTAPLEAINFRGPKPAGCIVGYRKLEHTAPLEDFRAPKPAGCIVGYRKLEHTAPLEGNRVCNCCPLSCSPGKIAVKEALVMKRGMSAEGYMNSNVHEEIAAGTNGVNPRTTSKDLEGTARKVKCMPQLKSRNLQEKQKSKIVLDNISLTSTTQETLFKVSPNQARHARKKSKDDMEYTVTITKKKQKTPADPSDIMAKVTNYHARGQLESLTVAELKCFLTSKKAKVGGKKEDLIQRITTLLD